MGRLNHWTVKLWMQENETDERLGLKPAHEPIGALDYPHKDGNNYKKKVAALNNDDTV